MLRRTVVAYGGAGVREFFFQRSKRSRPTRRFGTFARLSKFPQPTVASLAHIVSARTHKIIHAKKPARSEIKEYTVIDFPGFRKVAARRPRIAKRPELTMPAPWAQCWERQASSDPTCDSETLIASRDFYVYSSRSCGTRPGPPSCSSARNLEPSRFFVVPSRRRRRPTEAVPGR